MENSKVVDFECVSWNVMENDEKMIFLRMREQESKKYLEQVIVFTLF